MRSKPENCRTTPNGERHASSAGIRSLARDVFELVELQSLLVRAGCRESVGYVKKGGAFAGIAAVLGLAALLLVLQSMAGFVASAFALSEPLSQLLVGVAALAIAVIFGWTALRSLGATSAIAADASDELAANLRAVKEAVSPKNAPSEAARYKSALRDLNDHDRSATFASPKGTPRA